MRLVCVPEELTPFYLLELREAPASFGLLLDGEARRHIENGRFDDALSAVDSVQTAALAKRDRHIVALAHLYKAEIYRRTQRWEDALDHTRQALQWLRRQVTQTAVYNLAVALSFEGLIHFILRADDKVLHAFARAQEALVESERFWGFERNLARVADCQNLTRWMSNLLALHTRMLPGELTMIVPVYELVNHTRVRTSVREILPFQLSLPDEVLRDYLPPHLVPVQVDTLPFLQLRPDAHYLAIKILADGELVSSSQAGDILLIEAVSPVPLTREIKLISDAPFVRRTDGHIHFSPSTQEQETESFAGIPRVLIREQEDGDEQ